MKFFTMTLCILVLAFALVSAIPATNDETILGLTGASDDVLNPQDPQAFLLKKKLLLKKLLFWG
ncbi:uncharacterized protein LOC131692038 isoform X2 [Topomyia yanbarensis]|uniref:uncharacterized protein LOC131692038 isoform X2 n=1 Tax=Topomyia yanbarensis TaxID=2498891 RepID=UPI00273BF130|nr:uncharacterized protein LOC131692038 isoform X2 [Topomyia yanbarensis]